ncbi:MAG: hypothetical protein CVU55_01815 [Deltaproteobacteria bacterium HGW-Deltaproteobacteria-13]|jgi:hypothetical protein|nr:MAG: hypothetical protein CVU55_01815 [Deltaproteobacteria bacterium HGW-Deltaproteobacteria-13]
MKYEERTYRSLINKDNLTSYNVRIAESDLFISSDINLTDHALKSLSKHRHSLETYIKIHPEFRTSLLPLPEDKLAPPIIRDMLGKSKICGVGPMASVAGAISEFVGYDLLPQTENLIIENGGDIFIKSKTNLMVSIYAGESPLSYKVNLIVKPEETPLGICTSSASVGPSLSFGKADAVCVISGSATLADAAASAVGNKVKDKNDIKTALDYGIKIPGVRGIIIICGNDMGAIGEVQFV